MCEIDVGQFPVANLIVPYLLLCRAAEQVIYIWAMQQLHDHSILGVSSLSEKGARCTDDLANIVPTVLFNEDLTTILGVLKPNFRLLPAGIARVIGIDPDG